MRRLLGVIVLGAIGMCMLEMCETSSGLRMPRTAADEPAKQHALEPLTRLGRVLGIGWGDGYHACQRNAHSPLADLPPRSYAARPAVHPHGAAGHSQHWQSAAASHAASPYDSAPVPQQAPSHRSVTPQRSRPSVLQFPVPAAVLDELNSLKNDPQQVAPPQGTSQRLPAVTVPAGPAQRAPIAIREELNAMLDSLQTEAPAPQAADSEAPTEASPSDGQAPQPLDQPSEEILEDDADLLLDDQAAARRFIREPLPGTPSRVPASERVATDDVRPLRK